MTVVNEKINSNLRPRACHGVAVDRNFDSDFFGSIYVTEASPDVNGENTWSWITNGNHGNSLLEYNPQLTTVKSYKIPLIADKGMEGRGLLPPFLLSLNIGVER